MILALACALGGIYWGIDLAQNYGLAPGDGGVLAPLAARLAWGIGVASLGLAFLAGMDIYARHYIASARYDPQQNLLHIETLRYWGRKSEAVPPAWVSGGGRHSGAFSTVDHTVNAPWAYIYIRSHPRDRRWPLILDLQGEILDVERFRKLLKV